MSKPESRVAQPHPATTEPRTEHLREGSIVGFEQASKAGPSPTSPVIGAKLREQRRTLNLTLEHVATRAGITKGFLSEIERDKAAPSVSTLLRLRDVLSLSTTDLFRSTLPRIVRADRRQAISIGGRGVDYALLSARDAHRVTVVWSELEPGASSGPELHTLSSDEEIVVVIAGTLEITIDDAAHVLGPGDSFTFDPRRPHRFANTSGKTRVVVMCILAPPPQ